LYRRYGAMVFRRARLLLGDEETAWDVLQEVFVRALRSGELFRGDSAVATWLYRITTNYCFNIIRDSARHRGRLEAYVPLTTSLSADHPDLRLMVAQLLSRVSTELCEIAVYSHVDRMSHDEIATVVGVSRRTVGNRLKEFQHEAQVLLSFEA